MKEESPTNLAASAGHPTAPTSPGRPQTRAPLKPAYLILGDDLPKVEQALKRLKARIVEESGTDLNIDEFDASADSGARGGQRRQHPGLPGRHQAGAGPRRRTPG